MEVGSGPTGVDEAWGSRVGPVAIRPGTSSPAGSMTVDG